MEKIKEMKETMEVCERMHNWLMEELYSFPSLEELDRIQSMSPVFLNILRRYNAVVEPLIEKRLKELEEEQDVVLKDIQDDSYYFQEK